MTYVYRVYDKYTDSYVPSIHATYLTYEESLYASIIYYTDEYNDCSNKVQVFEQKTGTRNWECIAESGEEWEDYLDKIKNDC